MEKIKSQIDILKIKLTFFSSLVGATVYLFLNIFKLGVLDIYLLLFVFVALLIYGIIGVFNSIVGLNLKYEELSDAQ